MEDQDAAVEEEHHQRQNGSGPKEKLSEGELLKRRKERKKRRQERLIEGLEKKRSSNSSCQPEEVLEPQPKKSKKSKKKNKTVFETQQEEETVLPGGRKYTVSLALPGSILDNAQSAELRTYLAGQIARALAVFCVDEVIVFDDEGKLKNIDEEGGENNPLEGEFDGVHKKGRGCVQLARILQFLECPQYLRKAFFPIHADLQYAGVLNPTDMPHHLRMSEVSEFRDGVVLDSCHKSSGNSLVNVGLKKNCVVDKKVSPNVRVTVELELESEEKNLIRGKVVAPSAPRTQKGLYWGYMVRLAEKLSHVFTKCPFKGGYDLTLGTSERGQNIDDFKVEKPGGEKAPFSHLLIVFGGVKGLEVAVENDDQLQDLKDGGDPSQLFDIYLNTCPNQGSRTIRTEEAILVTLSALRPKILEAQKQ